MIGARALTMREVIDSFYKDCIEPSLPEVRRFSVAIRSVASENSCQVQQRLRSRGWTFVESQQAVLLYVPWMVFMASWCPKVIVICPIRSCKT